MTENKKKRRFHATSKGKLVLPRQNKKKSFLACTDQEEEKIEAITSKTKERSFIKRNALINN